jgi:hypothetical protein
MKGLSRRLHLIERTDCGSLALPDPLPMSISDSIAAASQRQTRPGDDH